MHSKFLGGAIMRSAWSRQPIQRLADSSHSMNKGGRIMVRTIATTSLAFMAAFAMLAGARADYPYPRTTPIFCEETPPLAPWGANGLGGIRSREGIIGRESSTGPTFPSVCKQESTMHPIGDELPPQARG
jgi:hypothetical protein